MANQPGMQSSTLRSFHQGLHRWYRAHGRKYLPWRNTDDPYAIYLSEIMLQQTQVKTVLGRYYFPFLKRFPTLAALAAAPIKEVLQAWQGLGYYNRAHHLHACARSCAPALPRTAEALNALPGIGRNTAHAVAAFAYRQPVAVMEANVRRVVARVFALAEPSEEELWDKAALLLDRNDPFDYNQAMMDIGALVCTKRAPRCGECPAHEICRGKHAPELYPMPKRKKTVPVRARNIVILRDAQGRYYATARSSRFLHGLYRFVELEADANSVSLKGMRYPLADAGRLGQIRQQYSHFTLDAAIWLMDTRVRGGKHWHHPEELKALPVSMAEKKIMGLLFEASAKG